MVKVDPIIPENNPIRPRIGGNNQAGDGMEIQDKLSPVHNPITHPARQEEKPATISQTAAPINTAEPAKTKEPEKQSEAAASPGGESQKSTGDSEVI